MYTSEPYARNGVNIAVSRGAVQATLSYVYMCMAGWPLNKGAEYYRLAADKAEEVIDGAEDGTYYYRLLDDFSQVHSMAYNANNPEVILGIYYNRDRTAQAIPQTDILQDMMQNGWGDTNGEIKFWKDFPDGPRKDATYFPKIMLTDGELHDWWYDTDPPSREVVAPVFMKSVESPERGTEFDYTNPQILSSNGEKTVQVIRLAQVYCWFAEATGRAGEVTTKAVEMLNRVRNRAGLPDIEELNSGIVGNQEQLRAVIQRESRLELATEGQRYFDVRRWMIAETEEGRQGGEFVPRVIVL